MSNGPDSACQRLRDQLSAYLDGELEGKEAARVEEHLGLCSGCGSALEELRRVSQSIGALPSPKVPGGFKERLLDRIGSETPAPASKVGRVWVRYAITGLAASFLLILALHLGGVIGGPRWAPGEGIASAPAGAEVALNAPARDGAASTNPDAGASRPTAARKTLEEKAGHPIQLMEEEAPPPRARPALGPGEEAGQGGGGQGMERGAASGVDSLAVVKADSPKAAGGRVGGDDDKQSDVALAFARLAPKNQTIRISNSDGVEGRRRVDSLIAEFQIGQDREPAAPGPAAEPAPEDGDEAEAREKTENEEETDTLSILRKQAFVGGEKILLRLTRRRYSRFLIDLDRLQGVKIEDGPDLRRWVLAKPKVIEYLERRKDNLEAQKSSEEPGKKARGFDDEHKFKKSGTRKRTSDARPEETRLGETRPDKGASELSRSKRRREMINLQVEIID